MIKCIIQLHPYHIDRSSFKLYMNSIILRKKYEMNFQLETLKGTKLLDTTLINLAGFIGSDETILVVQLIVL